MPRFLEAASSLLGLSGLLVAQVPVQSIVDVTPGLYWGSIARVGARYYPSLATDFARNRVVLFGGVSRSGQAFRALMEWDGAQWRDASTIRGPSPRARQAMAWDPMSREVLLFGGNENGPPETWTWNGYRWKQLAPPNSPTARLSAAVATDLWRGRVVLFGGYSIAVPGFFLSDTWEWTGTDWVQRFPAQSPSARAAAGAFCGITGRTILFSGMHTTPLPADTWEWDGTNWTLSPAGPGSPPERSDHAMAMLPDGSVIMHGGYGSTTQLNDTWRWDGVRWTQWAGQGTLPRMEGSTLATEPIHGTILHLGNLALNAVIWPYSQGWYKTSLLGPTGWTHVFDEMEPSRQTILSGTVDRGRDERVILTTGRFGLETYVLDAHGDTRIASPSGTGPPHIINADPQAAGNFAFHEADAACVLLAQFQVFPNRVEDQTWLWDGQTWTRDVRACPPAYGTYYCYDAARRKIVCLPGPTLDHWEYDLASGWTMRNVPLRPSPRGGRQMAYSPKNQHLVLFGGYHMQRSLTDTWEFDGVSWRQTAATFPFPATLPYSRLVYSTVHESCVMTTISRRSPSYEDHVEMLAYDHQSWRSVVPETTYSERLLYQADLIAYDKDGEIDLLWAGNFNLARFYAPLRFQTVQLVAGPRCRPGDTIHYDIQARAPGRLFVPALALDNRHGVPLAPFGLSVTGAAGNGVLPLAADPLFWASAGSTFVSLDPHGAARASWATPPTPALNGLRVYMSGLFLDSRLRVDFIASSLWFDLQ